MQKGKLEEGEHRGGVKVLESRAHYRRGAAEQQGNDAPSELRMEDLLNEEVGRDREGDYEKDAGDITFID